MSAPTLFASNTQTCTIGTEHFLSSPNEAGVFTFELDTNNLAAGDYLEVRIYKMILTGGTQRLFLFDAFQGVQVEITKTSIPVSNDLTDTNALRFSITQVIGTGRDIPWKVLKHT